MTVTVSGVTQTMLDQTDHGALLGVPRCEQREPYAFFDSRGNVRERRDARGITTYFEYDDNGNLTTIRFDTGEVIRKQSGVWTRYETDAHVRELNLSFAVIGDCDIGWADSEGLIKIAHLDGSITNVYPDHSQLTLDNGNRVVSTTSTAGAITFYDYDSDGYLASICFEGGHHLRRDNRVWVEYTDGLKGEELKCQIAVSAAGELIWQEENGFVSIHHLNGSITRTNSHFVAGQAQYA